MTLAELAQLLGGSIERGTVTVRCPVPSHGRQLGDRSPSLSITVGKRNLLIVHCHAGCHHEDVWSALRQLGVPTGAEAPSAGTTVPDRDRSDWAAHLWRRGRDCSGTLAETYLESRGLRVSSSALRYLRFCKHPRSPRQSYPAMIAAFTDALGNVTAVQRTYLSQSASKALVKPVRLSLGNIGSSAIKLFEPDGELGIAEGVETALSANLLFGVPVWAAGGARIERVSLPADVRRVLIFADHDAAGLTSAVAARKKLARSGLSIEILHPTPKGADWNDILISTGGHSDGA